MVLRTASARGFETGIKVLGGGPGADAGTDIRNAARLDLVDLVAAGTLTGHTSGKIVLVP
jgi:NADPH2:quinone reductase